MRRRMRRGGQRREGGIALVVVLWLVALLSLLAVGQSAGVRTETLVTANRLESARARAAAYGGIQLGLLELMRPAQARRWQVDGTSYGATLDSAELQISLADEAGKVDLNFAPGPLLAALLRSAGVEEDELALLVDAILDWRDPDRLRRPNGAEQEQYHAASLGYTPRDGPFQSIEELSLVLGMDAVLYHRLADSITVHSGNAILNPTLVSAPLLYGMVHEGALQGVLFDGADGDWSDGGAPVAPAARGTVGRVYTVRCTARMPSGVSAQYEAVVRLTPARGAGPPLYEMLVWRQGETVVTDDRG